MTGKDEDRRKATVKIADDRGIESLKIQTPKATP